MAVCISPFGGGGDGDGTVALNGQNITILYFLLFIFSLHGFSWLLPILFSFLKRSIQMAVEYWIMY